MRLRSWIRAFGIFFIFPAFLIGCLYFLNEQGVFNLAHIDVVLVKNSENPRFLRPAIERLDQELEVLRGRSLWSLDLDVLNDKIVVLPWVSELHLVRHWPDRLEVRVVSKEVRFLFLGKSGQLFPILEDGTFLAAVENENRPDVILLRGEEFVKDKTLLKKAISLLEQIPREGSFSQKSISELRFDKKEGFWATLMRAGINVKLGEEEIAMKADRISQVIDYLESHRFDARVIDANLTKKVLVRLRKDP